MSQPIISVTYSASCVADFKVPEPFSKGAIRTHRIVSKEIGTVEKSYAGGSSFEQVSADLTNLCKAKPYESLRNSVSVSIYSKQPWPNKFELSNP